MPGSLDCDAIENLLQQQFLGRIGCHDAERTYVVPVSYAYSQPAVYCFSRPGLKIDIMRQNPRVCFEVDNIQNFATWETVIAWGIYQEITEPAERHEALRILFSRKLPLAVSSIVKICEDWPFHPDDLNEIEGIVFKINLESKTGRFEILG